MPRFVPAAVASILGGGVLGATAVLGITSAVQQDTPPTLPWGDGQSPPANSVEYGGRCYHGHCLPCSGRDCLDKLPDVPQLPWPF